MKKVLIISIGSLILLYTTSILVLYFAQEQLIFRSSTLEKDYKFELNCNYEEIFIETSNKGKIHALKLNADSSKGVLLYFHGNMDGLERWSKIVEPLLKYNYDIIAIDYRGYGKSTGKRKSEVLYYDALEVYDYILNKYQPRKAIIYGRSLGSTFATYVASKRSADLLILETPFYSMTSIVEHFYPFLPAHSYLNFKFPSYAFIEKVDEPIAFLQGNADLIVPHQNAKKLFNKAKNAKWIQFEGGGHNDLSNYSLYWDTMDSLLNL